MNVLRKAAIAKSTLALADNLVPAYSTVTFAVLDPKTGVMVAYGDGTGKLVIPGGISGNGTSGSTLALGGNVATQTQVISATGAGVITIKSGTVLLTASGAATVTLAAPTAGTDDGCRLMIESTTAQAHTVTNTSPGFNNGSTASDVATFGTAIANGFEVVAYNGIWYVLNTAKGVTLG